MNKFAEVNSAPAAQLFADYCVAQGLDVSVVIQSVQLAELYAAPMHLPQVEQEFQRFMQQPGHARYQAAAWQRSQPVAMNTAVLPALNIKQLWQQAPFTVMLLLMTVVVYLWQHLDWQSSSGWLQLSEPTQLWRWFTPVLLHFSLTHLVFNLAWWLYLGRQIEQQLGLVTLLNVTVSIAVLSNAAQYFIVGPNFGGMSGVVYGLFGYCWLAGRLNPRQGLHISNGLAGFMLLWLILGFFDVLWLNMANWAHLGGLVAGIGWAWILRKQPGV